MMNASEARRNIINYIQSSINFILTDIENQIIELSTTGNATLVYDLTEHIKNNSRVADMVSIVLKEAGYTIKYNSQFCYLIIKW